MSTIKRKLRERQLAKRFDVALSFVVKLLRQYRATGIISPKQFNGGVKLKLNPDNLVVLADLIEQNNDATLDELCQMLHHQQGIKISRATMGRMTQRLKLTVKKRRDPALCGAVRQFVAEGTSVVESVEPFRVSVIDGVRRKQRHAVRRTASRTCG